MSILTSLFPLALSVSAQAFAAPAPDPVTGAVVAPLAVVAVTPTPAPVVVAPVVAPKPAPVVAIPAVAKPGDAQVVKVQAGLDRNGIIDRVAKAMSDTRTVQGSFTQVNPEGDSSSGLFYISRPGKVRFEYTRPEPIFIVSDGTTVSIEETKRKSYDAVPLSSTPLHLFLRTNIDLKKDGSVADVQTRDGFYFVKLIDKTGEAEGSMMLQFRQSDFELIGWRQTDGSGAETRVQLSNIQKNVSLKPSLFVVKDPADAGDDRR